MPGNLSIKAAVAVPRSCLLAGLLAGLLGGCAGIPPDLDRGDVAALLEARDIAAPPDDAAAALARLATGAEDAPLTLADAVHIALVHNPALKAEYAHLGFAAADVYDAGRLSNPRLDLGYLFVERAALGDEFTAGLSQNFTDLLLLSARRRLADTAFTRTRFAVAGAVQQQVAEVRQAYYALAGTTQMARMAAAAAEAATLAARLAERYFDAGNLSRLQLATERADASRARLEALRTDSAVIHAREKLARALGVAVTPEPWKLAAGLPPPPPGEDAADTLLALADHSRLDLAAAREAVAWRADGLGVTRRFRLLGEVEIGPRWQWDKDGTRHFGPVLGAELPLFNQGAGKVARAQAELTRAEAELEALETDIASAIHSGVAAVANARARVEEYRAGLLPQQAEIVARLQEEVNYMLEGPFDLLHARSREYADGLGYLEALRDYWIARAELARAAGAPLPSQHQVDGEPIGAQALAPRVAASAAAHPAHGPAHEAVPEPENGPSNGPANGSANDGHHHHGHGEHR